MSSPTLLVSLLFFFNDPAPTEISPLSLHDALPISPVRAPTPLLSGIRGSDDPPRSVTSTRAVSREDETATSKQPPFPDAVCRTAFEATSLVISKISSRPGHRLPSAPATNARARPTAAGSPGKQRPATTARLPQWRSVRLGVRPRRRSLPGFCA